MASKTKNVEPPVIGELTDEIHIDTSLIPSYVAERLAADTLELVKGILKDPVLCKRLRERQAAARIRA